MQFKCFKHNLQILMMIVAYNFINIHACFSFYPLLRVAKFFPPIALSIIWKLTFFKRILSRKTIQRLSAPTISIYNLQKDILSHRNCNNHFFATVSTFSTVQNKNFRKKEMTNENGQQNSIISYEHAVSCLNTLQSNAQIINAKLQNRKQITESNIQATRECLFKLGISLNQIDQLNVVHITGTKGKGSTAAFLECTLRSLGYKTGFYSSPHLMHVRERIRINGRPISEQYFAEQFFRVYEILQSKREKDKSMPAYFKFLTLLAFRIFCDERVDVAIMEVGIGGEFDCTNVIQSPIVCAITTLDLDHTKLLGQTIPEIAWHKAGIAKPGSILVSVPQPPEAMEVIQRRCIVRKCKLFITPSKLEDYIWPKSNIKIGIHGQHHHLNVSLALQLANIWLNRTKGKKIDGNEIILNDWQNQVADNILGKSGPKKLNTFEIPQTISEALAKCKWPGRSQQLQCGKILYHLDGAHTPMSIQVCTEWFKQTSLASNYNNIFRVLIFHCTGDRDSTQLLPKFKDCRINLAIFCPTRIDQQPAPLNRDSTNLNIDPESDIRRCERDKAIWVDLNGKSIILPAMLDAIGYINELANNNEEEIHVLVTGSFHLVGGILSLLDPECSTI